MKHVFLSYAHEDVFAMRYLRDRLQAEGFKTWSDEGIEPGTESWKESIEAAIGAAACVLVLLSPYCKKSKWVRLELEYAKILSVRIIPVWVLGEEENSIPIEIGNTQRIDVRKDFQDGLGQLVKAIRELPGIQKIEPPQDTLVKVVEPSRDSSKNVELSIVFVTSHEEIFQGAIDLLHTRDHWGTVSIFAPVGLWQDLELKRKWFTELAGYLAQGKLVNFKAIYGLPNEGMIKPTDIDEETGELRSFPERKVDEAKALLRLAGTSLKLFEKTPSTVIRFIPPVEVSIGLGAIIFEAIRPTKHHIFLGFSTGTDEWIVDTVFASMDADASVALYLSYWFENTLIKKSTENFVLKDTGLREIIEMATQWDKVLLRYYHPNVRLNWQEIPDK